MTLSLPSPLRGCLEISLFLKRGFEKFDPTVENFRKSFIIPLAMIPLTLPVALPEAEFEKMTVTSVFLVLLYRTIIALLFFMGGVWLMTWLLERKEEFARFAIAVNWLNISAFVLMIPYMVMIWVFGMVPEQLQHLLLVTVFLFCAIIAFTTRHALKVNWAIAVGIAFYMILCEFVAAYMLYI